MPKILIADDSRAFRNIEGEYFEERGFELLYAGDGAEAMRLANENKPDAILLDVQMPIADGHQVLAYLKQEASTKDIPVICISGKADAKRDELIGRGAAAVLQKPVQGLDVWQALAPLLGLDPTPPQRRTKIKP